MQHTQDGQRAPILFDAIDHDVIGPHHDFSRAAHAARFDRPDDAVLDDVAGQTDDCLYDAEMVGGVEVRPAPAEPGEATVTPVVVD